MPFLRYAYSHRGLNGVRQNLSVDMGIEDVHCQRGGLVGLAASWVDPANGMLRDQYILETFYRIDITPHTHLTPDIQIIIDPANAPTMDAVAVAELRLRTLY
ncbi:MAG: carbohydrate porin [Planctomycetaceae bacterium]